MYDAMIDAPADLDPRIVSEPVWLLRNQAECVVAHEARPTHELARCERRKLQAPGDLGRRAKTAAHAG